jgi:hypothetical protein
LGGLRRTLLATPRGFRPLKGPSGVGRGACVLLSPFFAFREGAIGFLRFFWLPFGLFVAYHAYMVLLSNFASVALQKLYRGASD